MGVSIAGMGGGGLTQAQTQKITDAVQADIAALNTKLANAQKEAILRYTKGIKPIAKDITDEQKKQLNDMGAQGYNQLFVGGARGMGGFGGGMPGGVGMPGGGRGAGPAVN